MNKGKLIIISGPSGVGKNTIADELVKVPNYEYSISMTTRKPRKGELEGKDYYFVSKEKFEQRIKDDYFLEYAIYNENYYGTPKDIIDEKLNKGINIILVIEVQGAMKIMKILNDVISIYIMPPSIEELEQRLINRKDTSKDNIQKRLVIAKKELTYASKYKYQVINNDVEECVKSIKKILEK